MTDKIFKQLLFVLSLIVLFITAGMIYSLVSGSLPALREFGIFHFISSSEWDPKAENYGALPFIVGTLLTSFLALLISLPFSLSIALFTGEYYKNSRFSRIISSFVNLLSGVPSIVYGLWGFYSIRPIIINMGISSNGLGILTSSIVLAIMIIPYASSLSSEFLGMVPANLKEASYSLGSTRLEMIRNVMIPYASSGVTASYILALGRALGETMAVTMLIGNTNNLPSSLIATGNSMASIIANQFGEADGLKLSFLIAIALLLMLITAFINLIGKLIIRRFQ